MTLLRNTVGIEGKSDYYFQVPPPGGVVFLFLTDLWSPGPIHTLNYWLSGVVDDALKLTCNIVGNFYYK